MSKKKPLVPVESLEFNSHTLQVVEYEERYWVRLGDIAAALEIDPDTIHKIVRRNPEEFDGYIDISLYRRTPVPGRDVQEQTFDCSGAGKYCASLPQSENYSTRRGPTARLFTFQGFMAVLSLLDRSRLESEDARRAVLVARRWGWDTLHDVMMGTISAPRYPVDSSQNLRCYSHAPKEPEILGDLNGLPIIKAYIRYANVYDGGSFGSVFRCPFCGGEHFHTHSGGDIDKMPSHRSSHCGAGCSPGGYYLQVDANALMLLRAKAYDAIFGKKPKRKTSALPAAKRSGRA